MSAKEVKKMLVSIIAIAGGGLSFLSFCMCAAAKKADESPTNYEI